ncbi:peptide ABC transporter permease [Synergistales bacterium]|nr:peptide ABC transporter permease [Synergistales bacterium]GHV40900.1 peptide ABC transporter permease [Synergistales bacterium]
MLRYIFRRILFLIPVLLGVSILIFAIIHLAPGDPAEALLGPSATTRDLEELREQLGLNKSLVTQYFTFLTNTLKGDFGRSIRTNNPVLEELLDRFEPSLILAVLSMTLAIAVGIPLGLLAALRQNTWIDTSCNFVALLGFSLPGFWLGLMLMLFFSIMVPILPSSGYGTWQQLIMPTLVLSTNTTAVIARMTRSSMLEVIRQDYIRTAKAKGLSGRLILARHILSNVLIPVVTVAGLHFGHMLGGVVITETVFSIPGVGRLIIDAIRFQDYPVVQGGILFFAFCLSLVNLGVDLIYALLDPRIKAQYRAG